MLDTQSSVKLALAGRHPNAWRKFFSTLGVWSLSEVKDDPRRGKMVFSQKNNFPPRGHPSLWKARTPRVLRTSAKLHLFLVLFGSKTRYFSFSTLFSKSNSTKLMLIKFLHTAGSERATAYFTVVVRLRAHVQFVGAGLRSADFHQWRFANFHVFRNVFISFYILYWLWFLLGSDFFVVFSEWLSFCLNQF